LFHATRNKKAFGCQLKEGLKYETDTAVLMRGCWY